MKLRWLHLSDIHFAYRDYLTDKARSTFFKEIKNNIDAHGPIDFVFITGDITDKNKGYNYELFQFLNDLMNTVSLTEEEVHIVPGNHDLNRTNELQIIFNGLINNEKPYYQINNMPIGIENQLLEGQKGFHDFYRDFKKKEYPKENVHFIFSGDENISVIQLNTSWLSFNLSEDKNVFVGMKKLFECLKNEDFGDKTIIAIGHHYVEELNDQVKKVLLNTFFVISTYFFPPNITIFSYLYKAFSFAKKESSFTEIGLESLLLKLTS